MTNLGDAVLRITAEAGTAIAVAKQVAESYAETAESIKASFEGVFENFPEKKAIQDLVFFAEELRKVEGLIRLLEPATEGVNLGKPYEEALAKLHLLREAQAQLHGVGTGSKEEAARIEEVEKLRLEANQDALAASDAVLKKEVANLNQLKKESESLGDVLVQAFNAQADAAQRAAQEIKKNQEIMARGFANLGKFNLTSQAAQVQKAKAAAEASARAELAAYQESNRRRLADSERTRQQQLAIRKREDAELLALVRRRTQQETALVDAASRRMAEGAKKAVKPLDPEGEAGGIGGVFKGLSDAIDNADEKLKEFGLSTQAIAVLLGAGLAGGVAGIGRVLIDTALKVGQFIGAQKELERQTRITFREGASEISQFADTLGDTFKANRDEVLKTANSFAQFAQTIDVPRASILQFSENLTAISAALATSTAGFGNAEEVADQLQSALSGDVDALKLFGITLQDIAKESVETFGKLPSQLSAAESAFLGMTLSAERAVEVVREFGTESKSMPQAVKDAVKGLIDYQTNFDEIIEKIQSGDIKNLSIFDTDLVNLTTTQLKAVRLAAEEAGGVLTEHLIPSIDQEIAKRKAAADILERSLKLEQSRADIHKQNVALFKADAELQLRAFDAQRAIVEAEVEGARRVAEAELQLQRVREDNLEKREDVERQNRRNLQDTVREVDKAQKELEDAEEERRRKKVDAERKLADTIKQQDKNVRTAKERLEDFERNQARRRSKLQDDIAKAHKKAAQQIVAAQLSIFDALRSGDGEAENAARRQLKNIDLSGDLRELRKNAADQEREDAIQLGRLKRDLDEAEEERIEQIKRAIEEKDRAEYDGRRQVEKAQHQLTDAQIRYDRAIEDSIESLSDLEREQNRALRDAKRAVEEAERARTKAVLEATRAFEQLALSIGFVADELKALLDEMFGSPIPFVPPRLPGFQHGGSIHAGQLALVGEKGPEFFIPKHSGTIVPDDLTELLRRLLFLMSGPVFRGGTNITVNEAFDARATAFAISSRLARSVNN